MSIRVRGRRSCGKTSGRWTTPSSCAGMLLGPKGRRARPEREGSHSHGGEGIRRLSHARRTGPVGQGKKGKVGK